ncbi:MAG TPA: hypothetical protein VLW50_01440 [Streptosporangiaceae bacterium]|nr:hypothetical protein [Streptosporangiaceae bacterium]
MARRWHLAALELSPWELAAAATSARQAGLFSYQLIQDVTGPAAVGGPARRAGA